MSDYHVIGMGEVGRRLADALDRRGHDVVPVTREEGWGRAVDLDDPAVRIVAVREPALGEVLERLPDALRERTVLVQNGFLENVHDGLEPTTRGLIWFTSKGEFFRSLCPSIFHGRHARPIVDALVAAGVPAEIAPGREAFLREMIVKGIWNAVVGLPLAVHDVELGTYLRDHRDELEALVRESAAAASARYGVEVDPVDVLTKIDETTAELGWVRGGTKAMPWRNGALVEFGRAAGIATPVNVRLLRQAGAPD